MFGGLNDPRPGAEAEALLRLGAQVRALGLPLVVTDTTGRVTAAANLPFQAPLDDPRVRAYADRLDRWNPPICDAAIGTVHYGPLPAQRNLAALAILQGLTIAVMVAVAVFAYRSAMAAQRDRLWVAMAREAAHQMGTPLTSLQGWIERVRSPGHPAAGPRRPPGRRRRATGPGGPAIRAHRQSGQAGAGRAGGLGRPGGRATSVPGCPSTPTRSSCGWRHPGTGPMVAG